MEFEKYGINLYEEETMVEFKFKKRRKRRRKLKLFFKHPQTVDTQARASQFDGGLFCRVSIF